MSAPLLVFALKEETQDVFDNYNVLYTGVGKVNAAYSLLKYLQQNDKPSVVINLGTGGSRNKQKGSIINPTVFIQRDMDASLLGFVKYQTPFSDDPVEINHGVAINQLEQGVCGTGDNFDGTEEALKFDVVDMEAYALALICKREEIPFLCLKYISDGEDDDANTDWQEALKITAVKLKEQLEAIGSKLPV